MARAQRRDVGTAEKHLERLATEDPRPLYVLYGEERYLVREAVRILRNRVIPEGGDLALLFQNVYASESGPGEVVALAQSPPFFDQKQLIVVREAERFRERGADELVAYAEDPAPFTCLVLVAGEGYPKGELFAGLRKKDARACLGFGRLKRTELARWIRRRAQEKGLPGELLRAFLAEQDAADRPTLERLENQLEMMSLFAESWEAGEPEAAPVFAPGELTVREGYRVTDALLKGDLAVALGALGRLLDNGVPPLLALSRLAREVRTLGMLKECLDRGADPSPVVRSLRIPEWKQRSYLGMARRVGWGWLRETLERVRDTDRSLKTSRLDARWHLEDLCEQISRLSAPGG